MHLPGTRLTLVGAQLLLVARVAGTSARPTAPPGPAPVRESQSSLQRVGRMGTACLAEFPTRLPGGSVCRPRAPGGPEGERATEHALLQQRVEGTLPESRCVPLLSSRGAGAGLRHRLGLHRGQRLYRAPSGGSTCREASPDPQGKSSLGRCLRRYC